MATKKAAGNAERGSARLGMKINKADLDKLQKVGAGMSGVNLVDWGTVGQPGPDGGWGVWRVKPEALESLISQLVKGHRTIPGLRIFPRGIPVLDHFDVIAEIGPQRAGF
jgi:hypothetical protein